MHLFDCVFVRLQDPDMQLDLQAVLRIGELLGNMTQHCSLLQTLAHDQASVLRMLAPAVAQSDPDRSAQSGTNSAQDSAAPAARTAEQESADQVQGP